MHFAIFIMTNMNTKTREIVRKVLPYMQVLESGLIVKETVRTQTKWLKSIEKPRI
jgi:hypothetical protein